MKRLLFCSTMLLLFINAFSQQAVIFNDDFNGSNDTTSLKQRGYNIYYRGTGPQGTAAIWFQGSPLVLLSYNGPDSGYLASNYNSVTGVNDIDNWLVLPALNLSIGDSVSFFSQSNTGSNYPDSIAVMYSAAGDSVPEDNSWILLGGFTVNTSGVWERKAFEIPYDGVNGRIAIRYTVTDGGPMGNNSDYIGIDHLEVLKVDKNNISGKVYLDQNNNGVFDGTDYYVKNKAIEEQNSGNIGVSSATGDYNVLVFSAGNFTVSPVSSAYYNVVPGSHSANFTAINQTDSLNDFALQANSSVNDLSITITPLGNFRAGMNAYYAIDYQNVGTTSLNPTVVLYPDPDLIFSSATINPAFITTDSIVWNLGVINPLVSGNFMVTFVVGSSVPAGTPINSSVEILPVSNDGMVYNNYSNWIINITGSFDPNEVIVNPDTVFTNQLNPPPFVDCIINFQNTGNDTAFNIEVLNPIDLNFDMNSFEVVASSHNFTSTYISQSRTISFKFSNVLLPDSNVNEQLSHGYIRYRIKPYSNLQSGINLLNSALIYFDFNAPVLTNTASVSILSPSQIQELYNSKALTYPNPASEDYLKVDYDSNIKVESYSITDCNGKVIVIQNSIQNEHPIVIDISMLNSGLYFLELNSQKECISTQFIKN